VSRLRVGLTCAQFVKLVAVVLAVDELDRSEQSGGGIYEESKKEKEKKAKDDKKMQKLQEKLHTDDERMFLEAMSRPSWGARAVVPPALQHDSGSGSELLGCAVQ
jgi:hypothetical protein